MTALPANPNLEQLKKQAKELLRLYRSGDVAAIARFRAALPAVAGKPDADIVAFGLRLHDAQSCLAREHGFPSWPDLKSYVDAQGRHGEDHDARVLRWLRRVYPGDIAGTVDRAKPAVAVRMLADTPDLLQDDPYLACAIGDTDRLRRMTRSDPDWVNRAGGRLALPPLVAITHSSLVKLPAFRERLYSSARLLLEAGADPNQSVGSRSIPASLAQPSEDYSLSALYGACGQNHDPELTKILLDAGADPNDNESLYHSLENPDCTRLLLEAGARIQGSNALYRVLDLDSLASLQLLLLHGADPNEPARGAPTSDWGRPLLWAIRRRRSLAHIEALLQAGADPAARTPDGVSAHTLALQFGLTEVARLLEQAGGADPLSQEDAFIAACARGDEAGARRIQALRPDLPGSLSQAKLRLLPELAAEGCREAVAVMVRLGWPIDIRGGDWSASALNLAVFRGDAVLTRLLLAHGANWREEHSHGDNACGTLSWASRNEPAEDGDWTGCAEALIEFGMPGAQADPDGSGDVIIAGRRRQFSDAVADVLLDAGSRAGSA